MPNGDSAVHIVPPIAGISIVHQVGEGVRLAPPVNASWRGSEEREPPVILRHEIGETILDGLDPVMEVEPWSTYYVDPAGSISIRFYSHEAGVPEFVLRTERAGFEYSVRYASASAVPLIRMDKEMSAYTLALAARKRGVIAHGCGFILSSGLAALCLGVSGAGKSTLARMMLERTAIDVLNDDRIAITAEPEGLHAWGTPWPGRAGIAKAGDAKLGIVAFIERGDTKSVRSVTAKDALYRLLSTVALPLWRPSEVDDSLTLLERLIQDVPVVEIRYPLDPSTGAWIETTLTEAAQ